MALGFRAKGAYGLGTTSFVAAVPAGVVSGDALYIIMESTNGATSAGTPGTPAGGWAKLAEATNSSTAQYSTLTVFGKIAGGSESNVTVSGMTNHGSGSMVAIQDNGLSVIADTIVGTVSQSSGDATAGTVTGIDTTVDDTLVMIVVGSGRDAISSVAFSAWANATGLGTINEREDNITNTGTGGGIGYADGVKATAGATGDSTWTQTSGVYNAVHLGIKPVSAAATSHPFKRRDQGIALRDFDPWSISGWVDHQ